MLYNQKFNKKEKLCNKKVIQTLLNEGQNLFIHPFKVKFLEIELQTRFPAQVLISVSKKNFKSAVGRNKVKRLMREAYRKNKFILYDYLNKKEKQYALLFIYIEKQILPYQDFNKKINVILQRLAKEDEENNK